MSLRLKYLIATVLAVVVPLLAYLLLDATLTHSFLYKEQAQSIRRIADLIHVVLRTQPQQSQLDLQKVLQRLETRHPDLDIMVLNTQMKIVTASRAQLAGRIWREQGIESILAGQKDFIWTRMDHHETPVLDVTIPWLDSTNTIVGAIHIARTLSAVEEQITAITIRHTLFVIIVALLVGVILSSLTYKFVIRPLSVLDRELNVSSPPSTYAGEAKGDEIIRLSRALHHLVSSLKNTAVDLEDALDTKGRLLKRVERFNEELEQEVQKNRQELLAVQKKLVKAEHLSTIGQLSAGLAHELRNPLFIIRATAEKWKKRQPQSEKMATDIIEEVDRVDRIIVRLLELGRPVGIEKKTVELNQLLLKVTDQVRRAQPPQRKIEFRTALPQTQIQGDWALLEQAFLNLVSNATESIKKEGQVEISITEQEPDVMVIIKDTGSGISSKDLPRVFEPFFSRKAKGTGLGLAATEKILELHSASITIHSKVDHGTRVVVRFESTQDWEPSLGPAR